MARFRVALADPARRVNAARDRRAVRLLDPRGAMLRAQRHDELHPTSQGFRTIRDRVLAALR